MKEIASARLSSLSTHLHDDELASRKLRADSVERALKAVDLMDLPTAKRAYHSGQNELAMRDDVTQEELDVFEALEWHIRRLEAKL